MPRYLILPVLAAGAALFWLWASGGFDQIAALAAGEQRDFQNRIARSLRSLRGGEDGALWLLLGVCFAYGFFHAVGPGHGKVLIGGYGLGRRVPWLRLSVIGLLASLGQAVTAIVLVHGGLWLFSLTREHLIGVTEDVMAPLSYAIIALIGGWLVWRGAARLLFAGAGHAHGHDNGHDHGHEHHHDHDHHHDGDHDAACAQCGHRHGPSIEEVARVSSLREAAALIGSIAIRPCTGALFVLVITWQMGIAPAGIAAAVAMALGTASVTIAVGLAALSFRGSLIGALGSSRAGALALPLIEVAAGLMIAGIAAGLLMRALG